MRIKEAGEKLKVCGYTILKWIQQGKIEATRKPPEHGGHWYWDVTQEALDDYLKLYN